MTVQQSVMLGTGSNGESGEAVMQRFTGRFDQVVGFVPCEPRPR